jgi:N-acetylneuraminate lyase
LLASLVLGAKGAVGSTFNYAAPLYYRLMAAYTSGDIAGARDLQMRSIEMIRLLGKYGGIATGKAFMKFIGMECGEFRSPVTNMDAAAFAQFSGDAAALDLGDLWSKGAR